MADFEHLMKLAGEFRVPNFEELTKQSRRRAEELLGPRKKRRVEVEVASNIDSDLARPTIPEQEKVQTPSTQRQIPSKGVSIKPVATGPQEQSHNQPHNHADSLFLTRSGDDSWRNTGEKDGNDDPDYDGNRDDREVFLFRDDGMIATQASASQEGPSPTSPQDASPISQKSPSSISRQNPYPLSQPDRSVEDIQKAQAGESTQSTTTTSQGPEEREITLSEQQRDLIGKRDRRMSEQSRSPEAHIQSASVPSNRPREIPNLTINTSEQKKLTKPAVPTKITQFENRPFKASPVERRGGPLARPPTSKSPSETSNSPRALQSTARRSSVNSPLGIQPSSPAVPIPRAAPNAINTASLARIPKRTAKPAKATAGSDHIPQVQDFTWPTNSDGFQPPKWLSEFTGTKGQQARSRADRNAVTFLQSICSAIGQCKTFNEKLGPGPQTKDTRWEVLIGKIHRAYFEIDIDEKIVAGTIAISRVLDPAKGLPQIFVPNLRDIKYPWYLISDAEELYRKWAAQDFNKDPLRGLLVYNGHRNAKRSADKLDPKYPHRVKANYHGNGGLMNGQWWPTQLTTLRDGAHGVTQAGIFGEASRGTYSIVVSGGNSYGDVDNGDELWYSGTDGKEGEISEATQRMIESSQMTPEKKKECPVRVLRSHQLSKNNPFRPEKGLRYDGLYEVVGHQLHDPAKMRYTFHLKRCEGQMPIRYKGEEKRPTVEEVAEYEKLRKEYAALD